MKKSITILALLAGATGLYAQGSIELSDYGNGSFTMDVFSPQLATPTVEQQGMSSVDSPSGSTVYTGTPLGGASGGATSPLNFANGALWSLAIYAAPGVGNTAGLTLAETTGQPVVLTGFQTSGGTGMANAGVLGTDSAGVYSYGLNGSGITALPGFSGGGTFQMLAWYNGGVQPTLATADAQYAVQLAAGVSGASTIESITTLGGNGSPAAQAGSFDNNAPGQRTGLITSFSLVTAVPEPSTIALGVIGASTFLFRRRK
jgi:hypothetical protein